MGCRYQVKKQITLDSCLVLAESKPDMEQIIRVTAQPVMTKVIVIRRKVVMAGYLDVLIEYAACAPCHTQPIHFAAYQIPFSHFVDHSGARAGQDARISADIEFQRCQSVNRRTATLFTILRLGIVKLETARYQTKKTVCSAEHISSGSDEPPPCPPHPIPDSSHSQPCSCVSCLCEHC